MSLAEQLLATMSVSDGSLSHLENEEPHIVIDGSRQAIVPAELKTIAVTGDNDIATIPFDCVRYWDGNDLSTFAIYLNYVLPDMRTGTYIPEEIVTSDGDEFYHFEWKIKNNITQKSGKISFAITAITTRKGQNGEIVVDKQWGSLPNTDCQIASGLNISNVPNDEESADILAQMSAILQQMQEDVTTWIKPAVVQTTGTSTAQVMSQYAVTTALDNNKKDYTSKISRNSKRITNIEKGYSDDLFETGAMTSVYERIVPYNALPYAEVKKIYGAAKKAADGITILPKKALRVESCKRAKKEILDATLDLSEMRETMTVEKLADGSFKFNGWTSSFGNGGACKFATFTLPAGSYAITHRQVGNRGEMTLKVQSDSHEIYINENIYFGDVLNLSEETDLIISIQSDEALGGANDMILFFDIQKGHWEGNEMTGEFVADIETIATLEIPKAVRNLDFYGYSGSNYIDLERRVFVKSRILVDNKPVALDKVEEIDISSYIGEDNFIEVAPSGIIRVIEDNGEVMSCKCEVVFMVKGV